MCKFSSITKLLAFFVLFFLLVSCTQKSELENALEFAGTNRIELEKVLTHYSKNPSDSLKLRAAEFLISNMYGKNVTFSSRYSIQCFEHSMSMLQKANIDSVNSFIKGLSLNMVADSVVTSIKSPELCYFKSDYYIEHIENAFVMWKKNRNSYLSFQDFCQQLLSPRFVNSTYAPGEREKIRKVFKWAEDSLDNSMPLFDVINRINSMCDTIPKFDKSAFEESGGIVNIFHKKEDAACVYNVELMISILRAIGVPVLAEMGIRGRLNSNHFWLFTSSKNGDYLPFDALYNPYKSEIVKKNTCISYFRLTNQIQQLLNSNYFEKQSDIPQNLSNPTLIPITTLLNSTYTFELNDIDNEFENKTVYLCTFGGENWRPFAFSIVRNRTVRFEGIKTSNVCLPAIYKDGKFLPVKIPFRLNKDGSIHFFNKPNTLQTEDITLFRKFSNVNSLIELAKKMKGDAIYVSNRIDFKNCKKIYEFNEQTELVVKEILIHEPNKYRYAVYVPADTALNLALLQFLGDKVPNATKPYPVHIANEKRARIKDMGYWCLPKSKILTDSIQDIKLNDNDLLTFSDSSLYKVDFGKKITVKAIRYCPKSDVNNIEVGDQYELFYWDNKWISLGNQIAKYNFLTYKKVPKNAILWLKNLTKGNEERWFIIENTKQVWI